MNKIQAILAIIVTLGSIFGGIMTYTSQFAKAEDLDAAYERLDERDRSLETYTKKSVKELYLEQTLMQISDWKYRNHLSGQAPTPVEQEYLDSLESRKSRLIREIMSSEELDEDFN